MAIPRVLTRVRQVIGKTFDTTAEVLRKSSVADTSGGLTDTYAAVATYPCTLSIFPIHPMERESGQRIRSIRAWRFSFPFDADVTETDRLLSDDRTFEVVGAGADSFNIVLLITAMEIL